MSKLSDLLKGIPIGNSGYNFNPVGINPLGSIGLNFTSKTQQLPNDSGSYQTPTVTTTPAPVPPTSGGYMSPVNPLFNTPTTTKKKITPAPINTSPASTAPLDYSKYMNPTTGQPYTPQEYADMMAKKAGNGAIPQYAGDALTKPDQSISELNRSGYGLNNARNDIATGATDPYKVASQSGIQYTPQELSAIEKAYSGVYDPALSDVFTKIDTKQKEAASALQQKNDLAKMAQQYQYDAKLTSLKASLDNTAKANGLSGLSLGDYAKQTSSGNTYIDLSTVTNKDEKTTIERIARLNKIPLVTDANVAKINAIEDTRTNLENISNQFNKIGYSSGITKVLGGFGASNRIADLMGDTNVGSFKSWRTAAINSIQALAGGTGSGLRINQAEINAAMDNDIPNEGDTVAVGQAKMANLKKQLNSWEDIILGTKGATGESNTGSTSTSSGTNNDPLGIR